MKNVLRKLGMISVPKGIVLDEHSLELVAELEVGGHHGSVAASSEGVWFATNDDKVISLIDPLTREETRRFKLPKRPVHIGVDAAGPVILCDDYLLVRVDPRTGAVTVRSEVPDTVGMAFAPGALWVLRTRGDTIPWEFRISKLDPASFVLRRDIVVGQSRFGGGLRLRHGVVSVLVEDPPGSMREVPFDAETGERLPDDRLPTDKGIAERDGVRWRRDGPLGFKREEIATGRVLATGAAPGPLMSDPVLAHGFIWACNYSRPRTPHRDI